MAIIERTCIENIKQRVSIQDVAGVYVTLKRVGAYLKGLSPFKYEKSPSFFVHEQKNFFKCYSSGNAGDVIRFVQLKENLNFNEAVEYLGKRFNIPITYEASNKPQTPPSLRKEVLEIHEHAAQFFHEYFLSNTPEALTTQEYWTGQRRFTLDVAREYKIGLAPTNVGLLLAHLQKKRFSMQALKESGLFFVSQHNTSPSGFRPRFCGRLMIPIRDVQGQIVAFTARQLPITPKGDPTYEAKYINSPETVVFSKGHLLFGLDHARKAVMETERFLLVEGQLDALRCWTVGLHHVVAPQGTAITPSQLALLHRYCVQVDFLLDGDSAGQSAALRVLPMAFKQGLTINFIVMPKGEDPDTFLMKNGPGALKQLEHIGPMEFAVRYFLGDTPNPDEAQRSLIFSKILQFFHDTDSYSLAQMHLKKAGQLLGLYEFTVDREMAKLRLNQPETPQINITFPNKSEAVSKEKLTTAEYQLLLIVLHYNHLSERIAQVLSSDWIDSNTLYGKLLDRVLGAIREGDFKTVSDVDDLLESDDEKNAAYALLAEQPPFEDAQRSANQCVQAMYREYCKQRRELIDQQIARLPAGAHDELISLQKERIALRDALKKLPTI
jgi:DNA primase